jgi:hypothetical protein
MGYGFSRAAVTVCEGISGSEGKQWKSSARCMGKKDHRVSNQADPCFEICEGIQHRCDGWRSREEHRDHGVVIGFQFGGEGTDGSVADGEVKGFAEGVFSRRRG